MMRSSTTISIFVICLCMVLSNAYTQCNRLSSQKQITFTTDQRCAPVTVTEFRIKYTFDVPQVPTTDVRIRFEWNDIGLNISEFGVGDSGFTVSAGDTEFEAIGVFTYTNAEQCTIRPTAYVVFQGGVCVSSEEEILAKSWARDNEFGAFVNINPNVFDVCENNPVVNAVFTDASVFNCNIGVEPDNPNRDDRYVQFVYGTGHTPGMTIRDMTLNDGAVVNLTDGIGNLVTPMTINGVTGTYFGPVDLVPFPADFPISVSFPLSAPANPANMVNDYFEVTMFNWNTCNLFNGMPASPNYAQAITQTARIQIIPGV